MGTDPDDYLYDLTLTFVFVMCTRFILLTSVNFRKYIHFLLKNEIAGIVTSTCREEASPDHAVVQAQNERVLLAGACGLPVLLGMSWTR